MGGCGAGAGPAGGRGMSAGMFFRASVRRAAVLPPVWLGRGAGALRQAHDTALRQAQGERVEYSGPIAIPEIHMPVVESETADARSGREGSAAAVTSGAATGPLGDDYPANAEQSWTRSRAKARVDAGGADSGLAERVSRPGRGRSRPATSEIMGVTAGETAPDFALPAAVLPSPVTGKPGPVALPPAVPAQAPTVTACKAAPAIDWGSVAAAARRRSIGPAPRKAPTRVAMSKDPCARCGIPGTRGCDHQLLYDEAAL